MLSQSCAVFILLHDTQAPCVGDGFGVKGTPVGMEPMQTEDGGMRWRDESWIEDVLLPARSRQDDANQGPDERKSRPDGDYPKF